MYHFHFSKKTIGCEKIGAALFVDDKVIEISAKNEPILADIILFPGM